MSEPFKVTLLADSLLPCPFCGGKAEIERYGNHRQSTQYRCTECGCFLETGEEWGHGGDWNRRATSRDHRAAAEEIADWMDENMRAMGGSKTRDIIATILSRRFPRTDISRALGGAVGDRYAEGYAAAREDAAKLAKGEVYKERYRQCPWYGEGNKSADSEVVVFADALATAIRALKPQGGEG